MATFKVVRMAKRGEKQLPLEFKSEWVELHGQLKRTANRVTVSIPAKQGSEEPAFDGLSAMHYSTVDKAREILSDKPGRVEVLCEEMLAGEKVDAAKLIKSNGQLKVVRTLIRQKDLTLPQFREYWLKSYMKLEKRVAIESPVLRVVASFAVPPEPGHNEPAFDGMEELYLASVEDLTALLASPIPALMRKEEEIFVQLDAPGGTRLMV